MPELNRRTFLKVSAFTAGAMATTYSLGRFMPMLDNRGDAVAEPSQKPLLPGEDYFPTTCWVGKQSCGISARRFDGRVIKLEGHIMHARNSGKLCPKGQAQLLSFYDPYRIKAPLIRVNEKGIRGKFREASWEEALSAVGKNIKDARAKDPRLVIFDTGRSDEDNYFTEAFASAAGATLVHNGSLTADAGIRASEYTVGSTGVLSPDLRYCNYMINWGWNLLNEGGNKMCWLTHQQEFMAARERGMKVITLDPRLGGVGPHTDEWLPIRPGTDMAFFLALAHVLVKKRYLDEPYLINHTNSPFLVNDEGIFHEVDGKGQVVDETGTLKPFDEPGTDPLLEWEGEVDGENLRTAFSAYKTHIDQYSPEWAEGITGLPAAKIQKVAEDLGDQALLGSKLTIDPSKAKPCYAACHGDPFEGASAPAEGEPRDYIYRPVGIMAYYVAQQEHGFQAVRSAFQVFMLLGAIDAVGGVHPDLKRGVVDGYSKLDRINVDEPPYDFGLEKSKYAPLGNESGSLMTHVMAKPGQFDVNYTPEVLIVHSDNPLVDNPNKAEAEEALAKFKFVAVIDPWMNETADHYADVVLPATTIEKYDGPKDVGTMYTRGFSMLVPPIPPLFRSRGDLDIQMDMAEYADILYGSGGMLDNLNQNLQFQSAFFMDLNTKYEVRDVLSRWARSRGIDEGVRLFEKDGITGENRPPEEIYVAPDDRTSGGIRHRFYGSSLRQAQITMESMGAGNEYTRDYNALPTWRSQTQDGSPEDYDLYLISYKKIQYIQTRATHFVHMNELEPEQRLIINARTAEERHIEDGDEVWIESHNALSGETQRIKSRVQVVEGIRPDTVAMSQHYGGWVHPWVEDGGPTPNALFYSGKGYMTNTGDQSLHVKVKVSRAG
jgi:anaerobic selenocysteine-containing dehydrogenase